MNLLNYRIYTYSLLVVAIFSLLGSRLEAIDGLTRNAFNARYEGLAGTNTALGGSAIDVALNPANLSLKKGKLLEFGATNSTIYTRYQDRFLDANPQYVYSNDKKSAINAPAPYIAFKTQVTENLHYGIAFYVSGGAKGGVEKITRNTPTGQTLNDWGGLNLPAGIGDNPQIKESNSNEFAIARLVNGISYDFGKLSVGISIEGLYGYQRLNQKYYDLTGTVEVPGTGSYYESSKKSFALGGIFGLNYKVNDWLRIAYSYQAHAALPMNGHYTVGINNPAYYRTTGVSYFFNMPEKHSLGFAFGADNFKVGLDFVYTNYGSYLRKVTQKLEDPWLATPIGNVQAGDAQLNFRDQFAALIGLEHKVTESWIYRLGYSYNTLPIKSNGLGGSTGGFFSLHHVVAAGFSYLFDKWSIDFGISYNGPRNKITGAKGTDWDLSHYIRTGPTSFNGLGYSYNAESSFVNVTLGATRSFE